MLITFSGNNGSGKSRLSKDLSSYLKEKKYHVVYVEEFQYLFLDKIKKLFGKKTTEIQKNVIQKRRKGAIAYLIPYVIWLDYFIYFNYLTIFRKKNIIIVDRYDIDYINTWIELSVNSSFTTLLFKLLPKGDIKFYIDVKPKTAYERYLKREKKKIRKRTATKHNLTVSFYKRNNQIYKRIMRKEDFLIIDGNKSLKECRRKVILSFNKFANVN